ncbi:MAG TPA: TolC family protein [Gemmatimonadaceae bacterium]|nr:TolC family protein [Gemmatimonadaceae bacterium]
MRFLTLLFVPAIIGAQEPLTRIVDTTARPITLDEAVRLAQLNAPQAVQARGQMRTTSASVRSSLGAFMPNLNLSMGAGWSGGQGDRVNNQGDVISGGAWNYSNGLSMGMTLFDGGRTWYNLSSARATAEAAEVGEIQTRYNVALAVKQQYFAVLAARDQLAAAHTTLEQAEQQFRTAKARVEAGSAIISDTLRALIQIGNGQLAVLQAEHALRNSNAALTRTVAAPAPVTALPDTTIEWVDLTAANLDIDELSRRAPAVQTAQANLASARAGARASRSPYLPTLSLSFGRSGSGIDRQYGWGPDTTASGNPTYNYRTNLSFSASYPLFDRFNRERTAIAARVEQENAEVALRDAEFRARQEFVSYTGLLQTAEAQIRINEISVAAAEEDLRVQQLRYELGSSTLLDVLTSQTQLTNARSALIRARFDYRVAKAQLEALLAREL